MTTQKIDKFGDIFITHCPLTDDTRDVKDCKNCKNRIGMPDPVKCEIKCKEI